MLVAGMALLAACSPEPATSEVASPIAAVEPIMDPRVDIPPARLQEITKILLAEPKVLDVLYDPELAVPWSLAVLDDGTRRFGYASYICTVLDDLGAVDRTTTVRLVDAARVTESQGDFRSISLGHADCTSGDDLGI